ncbi:MAG: hypothetical protein M1840_008653 [Geoglossum simile]|nr:MAG: hypothetical protein M1840_008653 [Geoglossum simile]
MSKRYASQSNEAAQARDHLYFDCLPNRTGNDLKAVGPEILERIVREHDAAVNSGDLGGAIAWTENLRYWEALKFTIPTNHLTSLMQQYYKLTLAQPRLVFLRAFKMLARSYHLQSLPPAEKPVINLWPLYDQLVPMVLKELPLLHKDIVVDILLDLAYVAQPFFNENALAVLKKLLPEIGSSTDRNSAVIGLLNLLMPTKPSQSTEELLPPLFHLYSRLPSRVSDWLILDICSRLARECLQSNEVRFDEYGIFTRIQSSTVFSIIQRLLNTNTGPANPFPRARKLRILKKKGHLIARWVVNSLSQSCSGREHSILADLEKLFHATYGYFHPSVHDTSAVPLSKLVHYLASLFVERWNQEENGRLKTPRDRRLNREIKRRYVLCLRDSVFLGIYSKSNAVMSNCLSALKSLAYLEPDLILPGALQRIYPSMQLSIEVHRTASALRSLQALSRAMVHTRGFRCHVPTLLELALPGIDPNDLDKTQLTLSFIESVCHMIPLHDLSQGSQAEAWIKSEIERMDYTYVGLNIHEEKRVLQSSTWKFGKFFDTFIEKIFYLFSNLPTATERSTEKNVIKAFEMVCTPLFASLSPDLYNRALSRIVDCVSDPAFHQVPMALVCGVLCKVNPEKALKKLIPVLANGIHSEINGGAGSTRSAGFEIHPWDKHLEWLINILSMCVLQVGDTVLSHQDDLIKLANTITEKCEGILVTRASSFIHHLLVGLTTTYPIDYSPYEPDVMERGPDINDWGGAVTLTKLSIKWHVPNEKELEFATSLYERQLRNALHRLEQLTTERSEQRTSDGVLKYLILIGSVLSGGAGLLDARVAATDHTSSGAEESDSVYYPPLQGVGSLSTNVYTLRQSAGQGLHDICKHISEGNNLVCLLELCRTIESWLTSIGTEPTAHNNAVAAYHRAVEPHRIPGLRKPYPRLIAIQRASIRPSEVLMANNLSWRRQLTATAKSLVLDLVGLSLSPYVKVRKEAQDAIESVYMTGGFTVGKLFTELEKAVALNRHCDQPCIKGVTNTLSNLVWATRWKLSSTAIIQSIKAGKAAYGTSARKEVKYIVRKWVKEYGCSAGSLTALNQDTAMSLKPEMGSPQSSAIIKPLLELAQHPPWNLAKLIFESLIKLGLKIDPDVVSADMGELVDLVTLGTVNDQLPNVRIQKLRALTAIFRHIDMRAECGHSSRAAQTCKQKKSKQEPSPQTEDYLLRFSQPTAEHYIDDTHLGYLVWGESIPVCEVGGLQYDAVEVKIQRRIGAHLDRDWFSKLFRHLKQEPTQEYEKADPAIRNFRKESATTLSHAFRLVLDHLTTATFGDVKAEVTAIYGDGRDASQHQAVAVTLGALLSVSSERSREIWDHFFPIVCNIIQRDLSHENIPYWMTFLRRLFEDRDPRRSHDMSSWLANFELDNPLEVSSYVAFKIKLLRQVIASSSWRFPRQTHVLQYLMSHLNHQSTDVRIQIGLTIATIHQAQHHPSYQNLEALIEAQNEESAVGTAPYSPSETSFTSLLSMLNQLQVWREESTRPGSSYVLGSETALHWLSKTLSSSECAELLPLLPDIVREVIHIMSVKSSPDLGHHAFEVLQDLLNIPHHPDQNSDFADKICISDDSSWYHRTQSLYFVKDAYLRWLFISSLETQNKLRQYSVRMLEDPQPEVRKCASETLSVIIQCHPENEDVMRLVEKFSTMLSGQHGELTTSRRHAAVLGLGAIIQAFQLKSPPPKWLPEVIKTLAVASDPGMVRESARDILSKFKTARMDTWPIDKMVSTIQPIPNFSAFQLTGI